MVTGARPGSWGYLPLIWRAQNLAVFKVSPARRYLSSINASSASVPLFSIWPDCGWLCAAVFTGWSFSMGSAYQFHSWRVFVVVCALPCVCAVVALTFMPESPRFYLEVRVCNRWNTDRFCTLISCIMQAAGLWNSCSLKGYCVSHSGLDICNFRLSGVKKIGHCCLQIKEIKGMYRKDESVWLLALLSKRDVLNLAFCSHSLCLLSGGEARRSLDDPQADPWH